MSDADFSISVILDPAKTVAGAQQVEKALEQVSAKADKASAGMDAIAKAAARIKMPDAFARQQQIFERIRGPMLDYHRDLVALKELYEQSAITANEYDAALKKLGSDFDRAKSLAQVPTPTPAPATNYGGLDKTLGLATKAVGIYYSASEIKDLSDEYGNLQNQVRAVTSSENEAVVTTQRVADIAIATRSDLEATGAVFQRTAAALHELGYSTGAALDVTKLLNEAIATSGATTAQASRAQIEFAEALGSGKLQGQQFRSLLKETPSLLLQIQHGLGLTKDQFEKMISTGKLTTDKLVDGLEGARGEIEDKFGKTVPTVGQAMTELKTSAAELTHAFTKDLGPAIEEIAHGLHDITSSGVVSFLSEAASAAGSFSTVFKDKMIGALKGLTGPSLGQDALSAWFLPKFDKLKAQADQVDAQLSELDDKLDKAGKLQMQKLKESQDAAAAAAQRHAEALRNLLEQFFPLEKAMREEREVAKGLAELVNRGTITYDQATGALQRWRQEHELLLHPIDAMHARVQQEIGDLQLNEHQAAVASKTQELLNDAKSAGVIVTDNIVAAYHREAESLISATEAVKKHQDAQKAADERWARTEKSLGSLHRGLLRLAADFRAVGEERDPLAGAAAGLRDVQNEILDVGKLTRSSIVDAFHSAEDVLVNFVTTGKLDFATFTQSVLGDITKILLRMAEIKLIGALFPGSSFGGASANIPLLGFAGGGEFDVNGQPGTDANVVMFRATNREHVTITPPGAATRAPTVVQVGGPVIYNRWNAAEAVDAMGTPRGRRALVNVVRLNPRAVSRLLR